jgi:hypothetical protein
MKNISHGRWRQLLAATLAIGSTLQLIAPAFADGTAAGTVITNTATATFADGPVGNPGTNSYNATSNTVKISVSEIAGISLTAQTPSNAAPLAGGSFTVDFVIVNTGNDPTLFNIPKAVTFSNTTGAFILNKMEIVTLDGLGNVTSATPITAAGIDTAAVPVGGKVTVRVTVDVAPGAPKNAATTIALGKTTNDNEQNVPYVADAGSVRTKDIVGETNGDLPIGIEKEAMDTSTTITVAGRLQAFAAVLKANDGYAPGTDPNVLDGKLTYNLALKVDNPTTPPAGFVVSDLYGTAVKVDGVSVNRVLVSDAIPGSTQLGVTADITKPTNWTIVYSTTAIGTSAYQADWVTTRPSTATNIKRIGFIYNTNAVAAPTDPGLGPILKGSPTIKGFSFKVTPLTGFKGGAIANIAQIFGQSQPGTVATGTATQIVYDESGDQTTNNGLDGTDPDPLKTPADNGGITDGVANTTKDGVDPGTGNDPSDPATNIGADGVTAPSKVIGGEDNVYTIAATPLNGPLGQPGAEGSPNNTNDDFTNKSIVVPPGTDPATTLDPAVFTFTNTVQNTSSSTQVISLLPTPPATTGDLPTNTVVSIKDTAGNIANYTYNGTVFVFTAAGSTAGLSATNPIKLTVAAGLTPATSPSYSVIVDLPTGTPQLKGFPVPVTAFVDANKTGLPTGNPSNITIDRLYTNYLSLDKKARILLPDGVTPVTGPAGTFTTVQADLSAAATPGNIIEYQITYKNISTAGGTNSVTLPANNLVITENGSTGGNTWFGVTVDPKYPTPATGTGTDAAGTISVTVSGADIQEYKDTITTVAPGTAGGTLTFQRKIK